MSTAAQPTRRLRLDHSPAGAPADAARRVLAHARVETVQILRNGEQLLLALIVPLGLLIGGRFFGHHLGEYAPDQHTLPASVLALALFSSTFTSLAIATAFERRYGVLERLAATPLGRGGLLAGKALAVLAVFAIQALVLLAVAFALGWRPALTLPGVAVALLTSIFAGIAFATLGLVLAGRLRAEGVLGLANLLYLAGAAGGALLMPVASHPGWAAAVLPFLPTAALGEALRGAALGHAPWWTVLVSGAWALVLSLLARKVFRWLP